MKRRVIRGNRPFIEMTAPRIWDLRRGDHDDNRTSPYERGLRSVILSSLLEFNFLKAAIGFVFLIVGPALLIGVAPSLLFTYGRLKTQAASFTTAHPFFSVASLVLLAAIAIWFSRMLLVKAVDNFWRLHYTLVFPMFIAVREALRTIAERFAGASISQRRLDMRRRLGTIAATVLLAGAGVAIALQLGAPRGFHFVDLTQAPLWASVEAALHNAGIILGVSTAVESLFWLWRELTLRNPVRDWSPSFDPSSHVVRVAHLSDLHVVGERYGYRMETGTRGPRGNRRIRIALRNLAALHRSAPLDRIIVTGDVTDAGTRAEWAEFIDLLGPYPELRERLSFVPGNHDVNIVDRTNPGRLDLPWSPRHALRALRVLLTLDQLQGNRTYLVDRTTGFIGPSLSEYLRRGSRVERLQALAENGAGCGRREMDAVWDAIYPLVEPSSDNGGYGVILLNSNARSNFSFSNAIGVVGREQLRALKSILKNYPRQSWLILLHHHVVEYPVRSASLMDRIALSLVNAPDLMAAIAPHASRVILLHGHRHWDWLGKCGEMTLCSAPSVTLSSNGAESDRGHFRVHRVSHAMDGGLQLIASERFEID